jgi:hypothetical protein
MPIADADKDHLAAVVEERWLDFQGSLSDGGGRYLMRELFGVSHEKQRKRPARTGVIVPKCSSVPVIPSELSPIRKV